MTRTKTITFLCVLFYIVNVSCIFSQNRTIEGIGDVILFALPATTLTSTLLLKDKDGSKQFVKAFLLNQSVTFGLKLVINKIRPDESNNNAFPSGHTSTTFQNASFIHRRYGFKYSIPAYILAGFTGYSRIDAKKHDGWDILVGAIVGIGSAYLFTKHYQQKHIELTLNNSNNTFLIGFTYKF